MIESRSPITETGNALLEQVQNMTDRLAPAELWLERITTIENEALEIIHGAIYPRAVELADEWGLDEPHRFTAFVQELAKRLDPKRMAR